ncbi:MAG: SUMF1/EgtB/PvdO family nonheme iron enzyme [Verrucomicrobiales bacterium]|nr:SUMF1/EgtB/PvdO family nonheme iron enzyme [Verrucomicrobiales bacterium]
MNFLKISPLRFFVLGAGITLALNFALYFSQKLGEEGKPVSTSIAKFPAMSPQISTWFSGDAEKGKILTNGMGMRFVRLPDLEIAFGTHEVTREQFRFFAEAAGMTDHRWLSRITRAGLSQPDDHPVVNVSWEEATKFCEWLSEQENMTFRLPTDYEWSVAAGLKPETSFQSPALRSKQAAEEYFWGKKWTTDLAVENYADKSFASVTGGTGCFPFDDTYPATAPAGSFLPNELGIYDMGGNVSEWVYDWYQDRDEYKTVRGASYGSGMLHKEIHYKGFRTMATPSFRSEYFGFRVVAETSDKLYTVKVDAPAPAETRMIPAMLPIEDSTELPYETASIASPDEMIVNPFPTTVTQDIVEPMVPMEEIALRASQDITKPVVVTYTGKDGINLREDTSFGSSNRLGAIYPQSKIPLTQIGEDTEVDTETWVNIEVQGWIPTKVNSYTFLEDQGNGTWKVVWSKPNDRYVAMRTGPSSDDTLISKVNYGSIVTETDSKTIGSRHYIYAKFSGWVVKRNSSRSYIKDL